MQYKITKPVRLIELFSGVGATAMAIRDLGIDHELYKTSEWETNAVRSYRAIHMSDEDKAKDYSVSYSVEELIDKLCQLGVSVDGKAPMTKDKIRRKNEAWIRGTYNDFMTTRNVGSILNAHAEDFNIIDQDKYTYILTYSWPCQSLSLSGKQEGMKKGSGTASSLLWEVQRILKECYDLGCLPDVLVSENVTQCHNKKNSPEFEEWLSFLDSIGYKSVWADMNSKDYGVAQNRLRNHIVSIRDKEATYTFPEPIVLKKRLKDYLEDKVDESFYISTEKARNLIGTLIDKGILPRNNNSVPVDLSTRGTDYRDIANCIKTEQRGIVNFAQAETGVVDKV